MTHDQQTIVDLQARLAYAELRLAVANQSTDLAQQAAADPRATFMARFEWSEPEPESDPLPERPVMPARALRCRHQRIGLPVFGGGA